MSSSAETILVRGARQLLTLRGGGPRRGPAMQDPGIIFDGALLIRDGRILEAGPSRRVENLKGARYAREIDANGRVVIPGFVDSHTQPVSIQPHAAALEAYSPPVDASMVRVFRNTPGRRLEINTRHLLEAMLRHGTTAIEAKSGGGLDETGEMKTLRVFSRLQGSPLEIVPTYFGASAVPPEYDGRPDAYIEWMCERMLPLVRRRKRAVFVDVRCGPGGFDTRQARSYLERARALGFQLKVQAELEGAVRLGVELGVIGVSHLVDVSDDDVGVLAASRTITTLIPGAVFHRNQDRYPPARAFIDAGVAVALATGFDRAHSPVYSMPMVIALACREMKMTPAEAICAATINGAHAIGRAQSLGSLEPGKTADFVILDVSDYRELAWYFGVNNVRMTVKAGTQVEPSA